jgi:hypothetical protein
MNGALPPSSSDSFLSVGAHCAINCRPTAVEPVKLSLRTAGFAQSSLPTPSLSDVVTVLYTPAGNPAASASAASASAVSGVSEAGLMTTGHPAASAGATLRVIIASGKFHGVMAAATPTPCLITTRRRSDEYGGITSPYARFASSANHSTNAAP